MVAALAGHFVGFSTLGKGVGRALAKERRLLATGLPCACQALAGACRALPVSISPCKGHLSISPCKAQLSYSLHKGHFLPPSCTLPPPIHCSVNGTCMFGKDCHGGEGRAAAQLEAGPKNKAGVKHGVHLLFARIGGLSCSTQVILPGFGMMPLAANSTNPTHQPAPV